MRAYRFRRRSFLASLGGAFGLSSLLSNLEASAEGVGSPPRLLIMYWPVGTVPSSFRAGGTGRDYTSSPILQPFETAGLREETIVLYGLGDQGLRAAGGGGSEGGVVLRTTGASSPGTRLNGGEHDDAVAGGPSFDQIFLKNVPRLSPANSALKYVNAIGDARVDSHETSCVCLSYGYETRNIDSATPGGLITENIPLLPELSPAKLFAQIFVGFMPGGASDANQQELLRALKLRKSVLDYALTELGHIRSLAPASERDKIDIHADAIRKLEQQLSARGGDPASCRLPEQAAAELIAPTGSRSDVGNAASLVDESPLLAELGMRHTDVIRAAFQCDLLRVATFQWASAVNKVAFKGLKPGDPEGSYRHHPLSHQVSGRVDPLPSSTESRDVIAFLANVHTWFNEKTAAIVKSFKEATDGLGNPLLDTTIIPFVTDTADATHRRSPLPSLIFGGRALGMQGGQYQNFESSPRPHNDVWLSIAQAYFPDAENVLVPLAAETFAQYPTSFTGPIPDLWKRPV